MATLEQCLYHIGDMQETELRQTWLLLIDEPIPEGISVEDMKDELLLAAVEKAKKGKRPLDDISWAVGLPSEAERQRLLDEAMKEAAINSTKAAMDSAKSARSSNVAAWVSALFAVAAVIISIIALLVG